MFIRKKMTSKRQHPPRPVAVLGRRERDWVWDVGERRRPHAASEPETESERDRSHLERYRVVCVWRCIRRPVRRAGGGAGARGARSQNTSIERDESSGLQPRPASCARQHVSRAVDRWRLARFI
jgi:hypothetical protein